MTLVIVIYHSQSLNIHLRDDMVCKIYQKGVRWDWKGDIAVDVGDVMFALRVTRATKQSPFFLCGFAGGRLVMPLLPKHANKISDD